jgi:hypothetical protein
MSKVKGTNALGELLSHWHSSMGDPIYAVGSSFIAGHSVDYEVAMAALRNIEQDILRAKDKAVREKYGWTKKDIAELKEIERQLTTRMNAAKGVAGVDLDSFFNAYVTAALWSSNDEDEVPLDANYTPQDFTKESYKKMRADADKFAKEHAALIIGREEQAGHDFWLTRNGHGAGFWDGDWEEPTATILTKASEHREVYIMTDRGKLYVN